MLKMSLSALLEVTCPWPLNPWTDRACLITME